MNDRESFLAAIAANPNDGAPRLMYADWLGEHGSLREQRLWGWLGRNLRWPWKREKYKDTIAVASRLVDYGRISVITNRTDRAVPGWCSFAWFLEYKGNHKDKAGTPPAECMLPRLVFLALTSAKPGKTHVYYESISAALDGLADALQRLYDALYQTSPVLPFGENQEDVA